MTVINILIGGVVSLILTYSVHSQAPEPTADTTPTDGSSNINTIVGVLVAAGVVLLIVIILIVEVVISYILKNLRKSNHSENTVLRRGPMGAVATEISNGDQDYNEYDETEVRVTRVTAALSRENQEPLENEKTSLYVNVVEYDDCLQLNSSSSNPLRGPRGLDNSAVCSGTTFPDRSSQSNYQRLRDTAYQQIVPKGGSLLPDIKVGDLGRVISSMLKKEYALEEEFKKLPFGPVAEWQVGNTPENRKKNRFLNLRAYDHNRVILLNDTQPAKHKPDYIIASYISGYGGNKNVYIATQAPMTNTVNEMWQMVWETKCNRIVLFEERNKHDLYWPEEEFMVYGNLKVILVDTKTYGTFVARTFCMTFQGKSRLVHHFHFNGWMDDQKRPRASAILGLRKKIKTYDKEATGPLIVHCSNGVGRTGTYIAMDRCLQQAEEKGVVNVWGTVYQMRAERINMVQTLDQYTFVYEVLLDFVDGLSFETN